MSRNFEEPVCLLEDFNARIGNINEGNYKTVWQTKTITATD